MSEITINNSSEFYKGATICINGEYFKVAKQEGNTLTIAPLHWKDRVYVWIQHAKHTIIRLYYDILFEIEENIEDFNEWRKDA